MNKRKILGPCDSDFLKGGSGSGNHGHAGRPGERGGSGAGGGDSTNLAIGQRIYNHGDMANPSHFGTVTNVITDKWGTHYEITPDKGSDRTKPYTIDSVMVSPTFEGHSGTRIVPEQAYNAYREAAQQRMRDWATRMRNNGR